LPDPSLAGSVDSRSVLAGVRSGNPDAIVARDRWVEELAGAISDLRWMIDPHWLILGGGVVDARDCWWIELEGCLERQGIPLKPVPASSGSDAAMLGAAHLAFRVVGDVA
jgi:glucokinase